MKNGRNTAGKFAAGNSGRPKGSRNKATVAIESLLQGQADALTQTAVAKALEGAAKQEAILKPKLEAAQARLVALQAAGVTIKDVEAKIAAAQEALAPPPTPKKKD